MGDHQTIADSKRAFHQQFPYVIPPLYRRVADELLVELHLLSQQSQFNSNVFFAVGLRSVFTAFTKGYRPEEHPELMFAALCSSTGFDADQLKAEAEEATTLAKGKTLQSLPDWMAQHRLAENSHYSRLMAIGILSLLETASGDTQKPNEIASSRKILREKAAELAPTLGLSDKRIEKDLNLFLSSRERMDQAVELMQETLASERRKRDQRKAEVS